MISLSKVPADNLKVLRYLVSNYASSFEAQLKDSSQTDNYFEALLRVHIAGRIYLKLRALIEKRKPACTFTLKVEEAVILHDACEHLVTTGADISIFSVAHKWRNELDELLQSILPQQKNPINLLN